MVNIYVSHSFVNCLGQTGRFKVCNLHLSWTCIKPEVAQCNAHPMLGWKNCKIHFLWTGGSSRFLEVHYIWYIQGFLGVSSVGLVAETVCVQYPPLLRSALPMLLWLSSSMVLLVSSVTILRGMAFRPWLFVQSIPTSFWSQFLFSWSPQVWVAWCGVCIGCHCTLLVYRASK